VLFLQPSPYCMNSTTTLTGTQIPVPQATITLAEAAFKMLMPVTKSDTPQDFGLLVKMAGLSVNDEIWNMIDPGKVLPRDPATLVLDIAGKGRWLFDIMDPAQAENPPPVPGKLTSLDIRDIKLQVTLDNGNSVDMSYGAHPPGAPASSQEHYWTGAWTIPADAAAGTYNWTLTVTDGTGHKDSFTPIGQNIGLDQLTIAKPQS
ncbi:MAG: hypothetical protein P8Y02_15115, partial [Deinococcales bacterium]